MHLQYKGDSDIFIVSDRYQSTVLPGAMNILLENNEGWPLCI